MRIAVIGAGAIGSVVAGLLTLKDEDVTLIGKESQVAAISKNGLRITGINGDQRVKVKALTALDCEYDLVIFTVKTQDLESSYQQNCKYLETPLVLTSQNGVQGDNILSVHFEREMMFSSIVMFGASYTKPGEVTYNFEGDWILGRPFLPVSPKTHEIADILRKAFNVVISQDIMGMKWLKLFVNFNNCIPALIGKSMQETFADMDLCKLSIKLLREGVDIVKKANINIISLPDFPVERIDGLVNMPIEQAAAIMNKTLTTLSQEPLYGSILQSIMRKKTSEIDFINGEVCCMARQMRMEATLNEKVCALVHRIENTGKFFTIDQIKKEFQLIKG